MPTTDVEVHARVVDGSSYSPLCDPIRHLWFVLIVHVTLGWGLITSLVERWCPETHILFTGWGDDDHITRCHYHPRSSTEFMDHQSLAHVTSICHHCVRS